MTAFLDRLRVELPVVQAGMGSGIAGPELAAAVSDAGGLGTIGTLPPAALRAALREARSQTERPIAVNLLLPFAEPVTQFQERRRQMEPVDRDAAGGGVRGAGHSMGRADRGGPGRPEHPVGPVGH